MIVVGSRLDSPHWHFPTLPQAMRSDSFDLDGEMNCVTMG